MLSQLNANDFNSEWFPFNWHCCVWIKRLHYEIHNMNTCIIHKHNDSIFIWIIFIYEQLNIHCTRIKATFYALFKLTFSVGEHTTAVKPMRTHYHCKIFKSNIWCTNCITRSFSLLPFLRNFANTFQILNEHQAALSWTSSSSIFFSWTPTCFISIHEHRPYK